MRFSYLLLAAAVALFASDNVVSAYANSQSTKAVDVLPPRNSSPAADFCAESTRTKKSGLTSQSLSSKKMLDDISYMTKKFEKWDREGYSYNDVVKYVKDALLRNKYRDYLRISDVPVRGAHLRG